MLEPCQCVGLGVYFNSWLNYYFCSFDHDGLGRYGDPINPDADLEAMQNVQKLLRPGHKMFLTVPIGGGSRGTTFADPYVLALLSFICCMSSPGYLCM